MKKKKPANTHYESMDDYTARLFHTHTILGMAAIPFTPYTQYETIKEANFSTQSIVLGFVWFGFFLALLFMGIIARRMRKRLERQPKAARWCLDIITMLLSGILIWNMTHKSKSHDDDTQIRFVTGWWNGLVTLSVLSTISRWYLRALSYAGVVAGITITAFLDTDRIRALFILIQIMIYFVLSNFLSERDSRKKFLEKQKLYEETQVFKEILDQTTDGILIYGLQEGLMYRNWENNKYKWWKEDQTIDQNLKKIKMDQKKSDINLITQPIVVTESPAEAETPELHFWEFLTTMVQNLSAQLNGGLESIHQANSVECIGKFEYSHEEGQGRVPKAANAEGALEIRIMPLYFREKAALALIFHDITERSKISILEDNNNYKNRLLASVSHELRTPLNASINFIQAAVDDPQLPENLRDNFLLPSLASNHLLLFLINDILDFSQLAAKKLRLVYEKSDVKKTVEECLNLIKLQAKSKQLSLDVEYQIETPTSEIYTDHNRLKQIILNLLSNAIKFTLEGGIKVRVKMLNSPEYSKVLEVEVEDTGIGISEEDQERLFRAFEKIDLGTRISINSSGVGLGLVISNNLVQMLGPSELGHSIKVASHHNQGSVFSFCIIDKEHLSNPTREELNQSGNYTPLMSETTIPSTCRELRNINPFRKLPDFRKGGPNELISILATPRKATCNCPKVLIVDDDVFNITALNVILLKLGHNSDFAYNGDQAIKKVLQRKEVPCSSGCEQYKLIFMDCSMPILDGFEATKRLKTMMSTEIIPVVPIIGCTAFVQVQERQRALASGMDTVCSKPLDRDKINGLIKQYFSKSSK